MMIIEGTLKLLFVNIFIIFTTFFYIFLFSKYKLFSEIFKILRKRKRFFFVIFLLMLLLSFLNGWHTHIPYDEQEQIANSISIFKHFFITKAILPRPVVFSVFLSFFNTDSYFFSHILGRIISFASTFLSAVLLFLLYRKLGLNKWFSGAFVLLYSIAPYNLFYLTINKPEAFAVFFIFFFIYLFYDYAFENKKENISMLYLLALFLPLIRFELVVLSLSFLMFLLVKFRRKHLFLILYSISLLLILLGSFAIFSGVNSMISLEEFSFSFSKIPSSFVIKMLMSPWLLFFFLFFMFIYKSIEKSLGIKQKWFFTILFFSFILLLLLYSLYNFSYVERYQKLLYPFLFLGLLSIKFFEKAIKQKKAFCILTWIFIILFAIFFSFSDYHLLRNFKLSADILSDTAIDDIQKNAVCFNNSLIYGPLSFLEPLSDNLNIVIYGLRMTSSEVVFREQKKMSEKHVDHYLYLVEMFSESYNLLPASIPNEFSGENLNKISQLCPNLKEETKRYLLYLDKPLSQYLDDD